MKSYKLNTAPPSPYNGIRVYRKGSLMMEAMTTKELLKVMKNDKVEVDPEKHGEVSYEFKIDHHPFGHLDQYGDLFLTTYSETISRPLSIGKAILERWIDTAVKGFRINLRRLNKWNDLKY